MLLAVDTATRYASIALHDGLAILAEETWLANRQHTVELTPRVVSVLARLAGGVEGLSALAVALGPGSYTGLRVGLALVKGLALARQLPIVGLPTMDCLAAAQGYTPRSLCTVLQAGRGRIAASSYQWIENAWQEQTAPRLTTWEALAAETEAPTRFCGEIDAQGTKALKRIGNLAQVAPAAWNLRRAGFLAELAWQRLRAGAGDALEHLVPVYL